MAKKSSKRIRDKMLGVWVTQAEREQLEVSATAVGLSMSEFIRARCLEAPPSDFEQSLLAQKTNEAIARVRRQR